MSYFFSDTWASLILLDMLRDSLGIHFFLYAWRASNWKYYVVHHPNFEKCFVLGCEKWLLHAMSKEDMFCWSDLEVIIVSGFKIFYVMNRESVAHLSMRIARNTMGTRGTQTDT